MPVLLAETWKCSERQSSWVHQPNGALCIAHGVQVTVVLTYVCTGNRSEGSRCPVADKGNPIR